MINTQADAPKCQIKDYRFFKKYIGIFHDPASVCQR